MVASTKHMCLVWTVAAVIVCTAGQAAAQERIVNSRCDTAIKVAMEDNDVVAVVVERIKYGDMVLGDVYCLPWSDPHGFHFVYFDFDCAPGVYCLWDPGVLVLVDVRRRLVKVVDEWYVPDSDLPADVLRRLRAAKRMADD